MSTLSKRFPRELKNNLGKYLGIFFLMAVAISLTTGFLVAASSIEELQGKVRDTYNQEDGQFTTNFKVSDANLAAVESLGVKVYPNFSRDLTLEYSSKSNDETHVMRVFANRENVDLAAYFEGHAPQTDSEIAIDRVYASNNNLSIGDSLTIGGTTYQICGILSLSDYQSLFEKNSDFIFNAQSFCVGLVTQHAFDSIHQGTLKYVYSFVCNDRGLSDADRVDLEEDIADVLTDANVVISEFIDADSSNAISYATEDVAGDQQMWRILLWMIIAIMAFVFVILTGSTIEEESAVIGTLLASGYRKSELVRHYLALPMIVGITGAIVGNVLGYTLMSTPMCDMYYNSYSLPPYQAIFNPEVLLFTTIIPLVMLFVITLIGLVWKLRCTPLQFLRHEISRSSRKTGAKLPEKLGFTHRFRLRVFLQNLPNFATLFFGIMFSSLLLIFGLCLMPCVSSYANDLRASLVAEHTYTLKSPLELEGTAEQKAAYAAALKLSETVDMSAIDEDEMGDKLADIITNRVETRVKNQLSNAFDTEALTKQIVAQGGKGTIAGISVESLMNASSSDLFSSIDFDSVDISELVRLGILTKSTVDLTDCGLGVVNIATFNEDSIDEDSLDISAIDFTGITPEDVGLGGVDLGGLSLHEFFTLADLASDVPDDDDAHPVNTLDNSAQAIAQAEKFAVTSLDIARTSGSGYESISVYGIQENSAYWTEVDVSSGHITIGNGLADKYGIKAGDTIQLEDRYGGESYKFTVDATYGSMGNMNVYMNIGLFNETFDHPAEYFNGYASNEALNLDSLYLVNDLTPKDMDKIVVQMQDSMGEMAGMVTVVSVLISMILMYLLTKTVIDHSARSISYMKVFGYRNNEINQLYLNSISATVVISVIACIPILLWLLGLVVKVAFASYSGNFVIAIEPSYILENIAFSIAAYAVVAFLHVRRIKRVPMALALKVQE